MFKFLISKEHDGKSLPEIIRYMEQTMGFEWNVTAYLASLDGKIIARNFMDRTLVHEGQIVKLFPMPAGG